MDFSGFLAGTYARLGVKTDDPQFKVDTIKAFVNAALRQIAAEHRWAWLDTTETITTAAGTDSYTPGAAGTGTWDATTDLVCTVDGMPYPLVRQDRDELDDNHSATTRARPEVFAIYADLIVLRPVPDTVYSLTHRYQRAEKVLLQNSDTPYLPDTYADAVCDLATALALGRSKEDNRSAAALSRYAAWLEGMDRNRRRGRKPTRIRVRPGGWL